MANEWRISEKTISNLVMAAFGFLVVTGLCLGFITMELVAPSRCFASAAFDKTCKDNVRDAESTIAILLGILCLMEFAYYTRASCKLANAIETDTPKAKKLLKIWIGLKITGVVVLFVAFIIFIALNFVKCLYVVIPCFIINLLYIGIVLWFHKEVENYADAENAGSQNDNSVETRI